MEIIPIDQQTAIYSPNRKLSWRRNDKSNNRVVDQLAWMRRNVNFRVSHTLHVEKKTKEFFFCNSFQVEKKKKIFDARLLLLCSPILKTADNAVTPGSRTRETKAGYV